MAGHGVRPAGAKTPGGKVGDGAERENDAGLNNEYVEVESDFWFKAETMLSENRNIRLSSDATCVPICNF